MAAAEYYYGTQAVQASQNRPPHPYAAPPQASQQYPYPASSPQPSTYQQDHYGTPPPSYSLHPAPPTSYPQQYPLPPGPPPASNGTAHPSSPTSAPYPQTPPPMKQQGFPSQPGGNGGGYLGVPVRPTRSHSQPPRVRFADEEAIYDSDSSGRSYDSESDDSRRRHSSRRKHSRHRRDRSTSSDLDRSYDRDRAHERDRSHRSSKHRSSHHKERRDRDTFLGAGVGGLVGDAIFPGLGTAAGLLLGGYGGRKYGRRERSDSDSASGNRGVRERWAKGGWRGDAGWDEETATYRKGGAVR